MKQEKYPQEFLDTPYKLIFELTHHHEDYIEFRVSYYQGYNQWAAEGIGWMSKNHPTYYLRSLKLNNFPAGRHYEKTARIVEQALSLKFQNEVLEDLVLVNIKKQFSEQLKQLH